MTEHRDDDLRPMPEQILYANILNYGAWAGIFIMLTTYVLYVGGIVDPLIDKTVVVQHWHLNVHDFIQATGAPDGWSWVALLGMGDYLNFVGLALLALLTIVCYLVLLPGYARNKDWAYFGIAIAEVVVLTVAASGLLGSGGH